MHYSNIFFITDMWRLTLSGLTLWIVASVAPSFFFFFWIVDV